MRTLPDFNLDAYSGRALDALDLDGLCEAHDKTKWALAQLEVIHRETRAKVNSTKPLPDELKRTFAAMCADLGELKGATRFVNRTLAGRLREKCRNLGFLHGTAVYQAAVDLSGVTRIELANPPSPRPES